MSTAPAICPVCGEDLGQMASAEGHLRHECPGPRISQPGGFACAITRRLDDVHLPGEVPGA